MKKLCQIGGFLLDLNLIARVDPVDSHGCCWGFKVFFSTDSLPPLVILGDDMDFGKPENKKSSEARRAHLVSALGCDVLLIR